MVLLLFSILLTIFLILHLQVALTALGGMLQRTVATQHYVLIQLLMLLLR